MTRQAGYKSIGWKHSIIKRRDREDEIISEEFFNDVDTLDEISSLVRESMQNSIDEARNKSIPVQIRFKVGKQSTQLSKEYFAEIYPHAEKSIQESLLPKLNSASKYLVIEDFNTGGLKGSISSLRPDESSIQKYGSNFWFFEWKTGETNKLAGGRGSWGIGKAVLSAASKLKTILVYSERDPECCPESNTEGILFGHSIFKYADINNERYKPHRNWMKESQVDGELEFIPTSDKGDIGIFCRDWSVVRKAKDLGTSIVIPFIKDSITANHLLQSIIQDYFIAILDDTVRCEIEDEYGKKIRLEKNNLISLIEELDEDSLNSVSKSKSELIGLCQMYQNKVTNKTAKQEIRSTIASPNDWVSINFTDESKEKFRIDIERGKTVEFIVKTEVPSERKDITRTDEFTVLFSKYHKEGLQRTLFTRKGIIIPEAFRESKINGILTMVIVEEGEVDQLQRMLRLAEGPAHKNWSDKGDKVLAKYEKRALTKTIHWVKTSALSIFKKLQPDQNVADDRSLSKYFPDDLPIEGINGDSQAESKKAEGKPEGGSGGSGGAGMPRGGRLLRVENGNEIGSIIVKPIDPSRLEVGMLFEIEFAYTLHNGDSFSAWDLEDFDLGTLINQNETSGVQISTKGNKATLTIKKPSFSVGFSRFDALRDVSVNIRKIK